MVVCESNINNIIGSLENTGGVTLHNHRKKLKQRFDIIKKLGQGTYGKVQLGINKETGQEVAIKTIKKCKIETEADLVRIRREIQIMSSVQHPNIIHIYEVFENREKMVLVMEYAAGGELYDYLSERKKLNEDEARRIFRQIVTAVYYCHKHKICHRDLKLENILLDEHGSAKIADFGLSNVFDERRQLSTFCGSPLYASPEIVNGTAYHGPEVDCWSLGVLLYTLVYGAMPFDGSNFKRLVRQISNGEYYEPKKPSTASPLIRGMLTVKPTERSDISQICSHWWVNQNYKESCLDIAEDLANQTPVRLDYLLSLAPPPPQVGSDKLVVTDEATNSGIPAPIDSEVKVPTRSHSVGSLMEIAPSAERRIRELQAPPKRKLEVTVSTENANLSNTGAKRKERPPKKEKEHHSAPIPEEQKPLEQEIPQIEPEPEKEPELALPKSLTQTIIKPMEVDQLLEPKLTKLDNQEPVLDEIQGAGCKELIEELSKIGQKQPSENLEPEPKVESLEKSPEKSEKSEEPKTEPKTPEKPKKIVKKIVKKKVPIEKKTEITESKKSPEPTEPKIEKPEPEPPKKVESPPKEASPPDKTIERRRSKIFETAEKFQNLVKPESTAKVLEKPKKIIIPGVSVGGFKKEFERKASLTSSSPLLKNSTTKLKEKSPEKPKTPPKKGEEEPKPTRNEPQQTKPEPKVVENGTKTIEEPKITKVEPSEPKSVPVEPKSVQTEPNLVQKDSPKPASPVQKEPNLPSEEIKPSSESKPAQDDSKMPPKEPKVPTESKTSDTKFAKTKTPEPKVVPEAKVVSEPKGGPENGSKLLQDKTNLVEEPKPVQKPFVVPNKQMLSAHNRSNSVPNSQFLGLNAPKGQNFENQAPGEDEIRKKRQQAVSIISNAITKEGARKSKSKPSVLRKTPLPFGNSGRSASGNIPSLPMSPEPVMVKNSAISEESLEDRSPSESKRSSVEITLRGSIPTRKTTKAEIKLNYPTPKQPSMEFTTEVKHHIEAPEKFGDRPIPPPMKFRSASCDPEIKNRDSPKERIIPISFEKEEAKVEQSSNSGKPPMPKNSHSMRSIHSRTGSMSRQSTQDSDSESTITHSESGEPIKRSPKEYIIPIAVEGGGFVTPKTTSSDTESPSISSLGRSNIFKFGRAKRMSSIFDEDESPSSTLHRHNSIGRDSDTEDSSRKEPFHMHRLRSSRPTRKSNLEHTDSLSSAEEDDDDDGFEILTAENLFSTLLSRVRNLTQRLNVEDNGRLGFPSSSLLRDFDNRTNSMFMNDPITTRYSIFNQSRPRSSRSPSSGSSAPWRRSVSRDLANDIEKVSSGSSATLPRVSLMP